MAKLERMPLYEALPQDYFNTIEYLWIHKDGKVYKRKKARNQIHEDIWGSEVWSNEERGYYSEEYEIVSCHGAVDQALERKLAKKFPSALKLRAY